jgi:hypothetical protein
MEKFLYVFSEEDKDALLSMGYTLLKSDGKGIYVFANQANQTFALTNVQFVRSDTLTF